MQIAWHKKYIERVYHLCGFSCEHWGLISVWRLCHTVSTQMAFLQCGCVCEQWGSVKQQRLGHRICICKVSPLCVFGSAPWGQMLFEMPFCTVSRHVSSPLCALSSVSQVGTYWQILCCKRSKQMKIHPYLLIWFEQVLFIQTNMRKKE